MAETQDSDDGFAETLRYILRPLELPALDRDYRTVMADCREKVKELFRDAVSSHALGVGLGVAHLVAYSPAAIEESFNYFPIIANSNWWKQHSEKAKHALAVFAHMTAGLVAQQKSVHRVLQSPSAGTSSVILYPEDGKSLDSVTEHLKWIQVPYGIAQMKGKASPPDDGNFAYWESAITGNEVEFGDLLHKCKQGDLTVRSAQSEKWKVTSFVPPPPNATIREDQPHWFNEIEAILQDDDGYRNLVIPVQRCGPIVACAPKVFQHAKTRELAHEPWLYTCGLTLLYQPGTELTPMLLNKILLVAEEIAMTVATMMGVFPEVQKTTLHTAFQFIDHSLKNFLRYLPSDPEIIKRQAFLERLTIRVATEFATTPGSQKKKGTWITAGFDSEPLQKTIELAVFDGHKKNGRSLELNISALDNEPVKAATVAALIELARNMVKDNEGETHGDCFLGVTAERAGTYAIMQRCRFSSPDQARGLLHEIPKRLARLHSRSEIRGMETVFMLLRPLGALGGTQFGFSLGESGKEAKRTKQQLGDWIWVEAPEAWFAEDWEFGTITDYTFTLTIGSLKLGA